jgi:protein-S-isoprenylcysteine O-methyltransferase Ste14
MFFFLVGIAPLMALGLAFLGLATLSTNLMGWFLLVMGLSYAIGGPLYIWKRKNEPPAHREELGDRSFWLVQPGFAIAIFGAPLEYLQLPEVLPRLIWMEVIGWVLLSASIGLQVWGRQAIRGQFSGHVQIQPHHRLIQSGPYRFIRHPGYLGYLLMTSGVGVCFSSLVSLAAVLVLLLPGLIYRISVEEKLLIAEFGDDYRVYAQKTYRLVPGVW